jgi:hypothetical protein
MSTEHVAEPEPAERRVEAPAPSAIGSDGLDQARILALQRRAGNRVVGRMLKAASVRVARDDAVTTLGITSTKPSPTPAPAPAPAKPVQVDDATATAGAQQVLDYIRDWAKLIARGKRSVVGSEFLKRLESFYLKEYLAAPGPAKGKEAAEDKIGKTFAGPATAGDFWEEGAIKQWNQQKIPPAARLIAPELPAEMAAATDILSIPNRAILPYIDVPHLVGKPNTGTGADVDVSGGGKNISQLMHWATGVKYSQISQKTMREFFLAYELWHLEAWDVFGEDPINDLIAEEAGRILGVKLRFGTLTKANLVTTLDDAFNEARAWVGSLLRVRRGELERWILEKTQRRANMWWGAMAPMDIWGPDTIFSMLKRGKSVDEVKASSLVERIAAIYALIEESYEWESAHTTIDNGPFIEKMLKGELDAAFAKSAKGEPVTSADLAPPAAPVK